MEQQMAVSGADRVLFMASKWNGDTLVEERHCWYYRDVELRGKIIAGWKQFAADLAVFVPSTVEAPKPTGKAPETLPALHIVLKGEVSASNLDEFKDVALTAIRSVNRDLQTDQDFADSAKARKWCESIEEKVEGAKNHALSQTSSIDALFRALDEVSAEARTVRLELEKLEKARNLARNGEIVADGVAKFAQYIREINASLPANYMPQVPTDFGGCIKNLRTITSKQNAVDSELARAKIAASEIATRIRTNVGLLDAASAPMLFADMSTLVLKQSDDLAAVIAQRLAAEQARKDAEREKIRAEEAARLEREALAEQREKERQAEIAAAVLLVRQQRQEQEEVSQQGADALVHAVGAVQDGPNPADFKVDEILTKNGSFAPITATGVRVTHIPTGTTVESTECRSQHGNRAVAFEEVIKKLPADDGARMTLGQINERIAPVSIAVAGLSMLGFEPVAVVKAARMYRACDLPAMCKAISAHVLAAHVKEAA
jgi:hypothetical protein